MLIITFHNDSSGDLAVGNYNVGVYINRTKLYDGRIEGHDRMEGWEKLVTDWVEQLNEEKKAWVNKIKEKTK